MTYSLRRSLGKSVLAALPVLAGALSLRDAFPMATLCAIVFVGLAIFFKNMWGLFPKDMLGFSVVLTLACLGSWAWYFLDIAPFWVASALILGVFDFKVKTKRPRIKGKDSERKVISSSVIEILYRAASYWLLIVGFGFVNSAAGISSGAILLAHPGISLLILTAVIFLVHLTPAHKTKKVLERDA
jgi:hypothetical protein